MYKIPRKTLSMSGSIFDSKNEFATHTIVLSRFITTFAEEGGGGTPPVPFEPSKDHRKVVFLY
ncbi:MAG: hypothetical protein IJ623_00015 [Bacteroidales bacterium]|nr:hypothetical protein [Bacteroidales bacterium]